MSSSSGPARTLGRLGLGSALAFAGTSHLSWARKDFQAQVPSWFPLDDDLVVLVSGVVEIGFGLLLLGAPRRFRPVVGAAVAAFFVVIFPGNIGQWREGIDAFGLDTDTKRFVRLFFQPVLVALALWSTNAIPWLSKAVSRKAGIAR